MSHDFTLKRLLVFLTFFIGSLILSLMMFNVVSIIRYFIVDGIFFLFDIIIGIFIIIIIIKMFKKLFSSSSLFFLLAIIIICFLGQKMHNNSYEIKNKIQNFLEPSFLFFYLWSSICTCSYNEKKQLISRFSFFSIWVINGIYFIPFKFLLFYEGINEEISKKENSKIIPFFYLDSREISSTKYKFKNLKEVFMYKIGNSLFDFLFRNLLTQKINWKKISFEFFFNVFFVWIYFYIKKNFVFSFFQEYEINWFYTGLIIFAIIFLCFIIYLIKQKNDYEKRKRFK